MKVLQSLSSVTLFLIFSSMSALFTFEDAKAQIDEDTMNKVKKIIDGYPSILYGSPNIPPVEETIARQSRPNLDETLCESSSKIRMSAQFTNPEKVKRYPRLLNNKDGLLWQAWYVLSRNKMAWKCRLTLVKMPDGEEQILREFYNQSFALVEGS